MDDITKEAGVSKGLIYTYFKSKEEIFFELAESRGEFISAVSPDHRIGENLSRTMPLSEKLIYVWDETVRQWTAENLDFARIKFEFWLESSKNETLRERMKEKSEKSLNLIEEIIIRSRPDVSPETVSAFSRLWWSQVDGLVAYFVSHHQLPSEDEMLHIRKIVLHLCRFFDDEKPKPTAVDPPDPSGP